MLRIRTDQIDALSKQQESGFTNRMAAHLREVFPEEVARLDDARLRLFVEKVCEYASEWGIEEETQVERLIELFACFEELRRRPLPDWVNEIVTYPDRPGSQILARLEESLLFEEAGDVD